MEDLSQQPENSTPQLQRPTSDGLPVYFTEPIDRVEAGKRIVLPIAALAFLLSGCGGSTQPIPTKTPSEFDPNREDKWKLLLTQASPDCNTWTAPLNPDGTTPSTTAVEVCTPKFLGMSQVGQNFAELDDNNKSHWGLPQYKIEADVNLGSSATGSFGGILVDTTWANEPSGYMLAIFGGRFLVLNAAELATGSSINAATLFTDAIPNTEGANVKAKVIRATTGSQTSLYFYVGEGAPVCSIPVSSAQNQFARFGLVSGNPNAQSSGQVDFSNIAISVLA